MTRSSTTRRVALPLEVPDEVTPGLLQAAAGTFGLLAATNRLHIVLVLADGEADVGTIADMVGATVATTSQHLAKLKDAGLVTARRAGRHRVYGMADEHVTALAQLGVIRHLNVGLS